MRGLAIASRAALLSGAAMMLSGCMTLRPTQDFTCPGFYDTVQSGTISHLVADIQRDANAYDPLPPPPPTTSEGVIQHDPLSESILGLMERRKSTNDLPSIVEARPRDILLLSGGGQWGAYGAGLFEALASENDEHLALPNIGVITGISTGSLQTLLLMVALDETQERETRELAIQRLVEGYSPARESDVVHNSGMKWGVAFQGSQAGTDALRRRIGNALCPEGGDCRLVDAIRKSTIDGYIGFVAADTGGFRYVQVNELAKKVSDDRQAVECLTAAAMASSAMPVFHQQLRVSDAGKTHTLYDGGVRRSVFLERAAELLDEEIKRQLGADAANGTVANFMTAYRAKAPIFYVVRNGPTTRDIQELNEKNGAKQNGQRGYDLLVNEAEISSIAALRLHNPFGRIMITTADGWTRMDDGVWPDRKEARRMMFDPEFMKALQKLGAFNAKREGGPIEGPWWELSPLNPLGTMAGGDRRLRDE